MPDLEVLPFWPARLRRSTSRPPPTRAQATRGARSTTGFALSSTRRRTPARRRSSGASERSPSTDFVDGEQAMRRKRRRYAGLPDGHAQHDADRAAAHARLTCAPTGSTSSTHRIGEGRARRSGAAPIIEPAPRHRPAERKVATYPDTVRHCTEGSPESRMKSAVSSSRADRGARIWPHS